MIYFYSATGNSRFAAEYLAEKLDDKAINLLSEEANEYMPEKGEAVGFLFPIYCWGIPPVVSGFLEKISRNLSNGRYVWAVCTCGDEAGIAMRQLNLRIEEMRGLEADALFSLIMPNTYVLLPGFDVDKPDVEAGKLRKAPSRLDEIAAAVGSRRKGIYDVHEGSVPALRTRTLFPLFEKWGVFPKYWKSSDECIGCGKCASSCPARNITMADGRPHWGPRCFSCCACFHVCPVKAVNYGSITRNKSQYQHFLK